MDLGKINKSRIENAEGERNGKEYRGEVKKLYEHSSKNHPVCDQAAENHPDHNQPAGNHPNYNQPSENHPVYNPPANNRKYPAYNHNHPANNHNHPAYNHTESEKSESLQRGRRSPRFDDILWKNQDYFYDIKDAEEIDVNEVIRSPKVDKKDCVFGRVNENIAERKCGNNFGQNEFDVQRKDGGTQTTPTIKRRQRNEWQQEKGQTEHSRLLFPSTLGQGNIQAIMHISSIYNIFHLNGGDRGGGAHNSRNNLIFKKSVF